MMKKLLLSCLLASMLVGMLFTFSGVGSTSAHAAGAVRLSSNTAAHVASAVQKSLSEQRVIPNCRSCCPSGDFTNSWTFSWLSGLVHENITASFHRPGNCSGTVTVNWFTCTRDIQNAAILKCFNFQDGNMSWVEADINVTIPPYVNHSTWGQIGESPEPNSFSINQGANP